MKFPTIDLSPYLRAPFPNDPQFPSDEQREVARVVDECFRGIGILFVQNISLTEEVLAAMNKIANALFALPEDHKQEKLILMKMSMNMGYLPFNIEALNTERGPDIKETFNFQFGEGMEQDFTGCPATFAETARTFWDSMTVTARALCIVYSVALDLPADYFLAALKKNNSSTIRLLHYPPCNFPESDQEQNSGAIRAGEHTDFGLFTFLFTDGPGLQARTNRTSELELKRQDEWVDVPEPRGNESIVVLGALMSRWTNDCWPAAAHRVIVPDTYQASLNRLTIACFFQPDPDFVVSVHPNFVTDQQEKKYEPINAKDYISHRLRQHSAFVADNIDSSVVQDSAS